MHFPYFPVSQGFSGALPWGTFLKESDSENPTSDFSRNVIDFLNCM